MNRRRLWSSALMRAAAIVVTAAPVALAQTPASGPALVRPRLERMVRDTTLANGLTVIVAENHASPVVTVLVAVRTGAFTQVAGDEGISHVFEHVLFRAFGDEDRWNEEVGRINGASNGMTTEEYVAYYVTTPSLKTERATQMLGELVIAPKWRTSDLEAEMKIVINEYERNASDASFGFREETERLLWGESWPRKNALGSPATINAIVKDRLRDVYGRYYVPNNAAVIITGDVSPAQAYAWVDKHFRKWQPGPDPFATAIPPVKPLAAPAVTVVAGAVDQVTVSIQWHGPSARSNVRDTYAADVFSDVLNAGISGFQERLSGAGLFQDISISYHTQNHTGPITIRGITTADNAADAIQALRNEIAKFDDPGYLTQDLLDIAKKRRLVAAEFGLERGSALAHTLAANWSVSGLDYFLGYVDNMQTVKLDELQKYVTTYIAGKPFAAAALTSPAHKPALTALMTSTFGQGVIK